MQQSNPEIVWTAWSAAFSAQKKKEKKNMHHDVHLQKEVRSVATTTKPKRDHGFRPRRAFVRNINKLRKEFILKHTRGGLGASNQIFMRHLS